MNKEFIPYEQALALKELGFNEPCLGRYWIKDFQIRSPKNYNASDEKIDSVSAPLYQQAFRWFREKYDLWQDISVFVWDYDKNQLGFHITTYLNPINVNTEKKRHLEVYETYEEAELECLRKLIQIVKDLAVTE
jgi:hypothetical protein